MKNVANLFLMYILLCNTEVILFDLITATSALCILLPALQTSTGAMKFGSGESFSLTMYVVSELTEICHHLDCFVK